jgi:hypothetical protein
MSEGVGPLACFQKQGPGRVGSPMAKKEPPRRLVEGPLGWAERKRVRHRAFEDELVITGGCRC